MSERYKQINTLPDLPSKEDEFANGIEPGPFERVASAVTEVIRQGGVGGKLLGIEGP